MRKLEQYKTEIVNALTDSVSLVNNKNKAGKLDINKDAEEFYRGLLNLFYGWELINANTEKDPNYVGVDLLDNINKIAVQVTSEQDSEKIHKSIRGFKDKALKDGYKELYVLMFKGKPDFPKADFAKTVGNDFTFDRNKHIIDHSDLCAKLKDAEFDYIEAVYIYLQKHGCLPYSDIDENIDDLGIIDEIFTFISENLPKKTSVFSIDSEIFTHLKIKVPLNFPEKQRNRLSEMIKNTTDKRILVQSCLQNYDEEIKVADLREQIQKKYCEIRGVNNHEEPIRDVQFIERLAINILPKNKKNNAHYQANAKAIVLYFFEFCDIGKKTEGESNQQKSLFD